MTTRSFGNPKAISGAAVTAKATLVPVGHVQRTKLRPIPIDYTTPTFVINATAANPVYIWVGNDLFMLEETLTYTWTAADNDILNSSGAVVESQAAVLGGWYFYVGISVSSTTGAGSFVLYPSQTAPNEASLNHPGTSKVRDYAYVGYQVVQNVTTIATVAMTKLGYRMNFAAMTIATAAGTTAWAELAFTGAKALPKHGALGCKVGGHFNAGAAKTVTIGSLSTSTYGIIVGGNPTATGDQYFPFETYPNANGKLYAVDSGARGDVSVTYIEDIV